MFFNTGWKVQYKPTKDVFFVLRTPKEYELLFDNDEPYYTIGSQHNSWIIPKSKMEDGSFIFLERCNV